MTQLQAVVRSSVFSVGFVDGVLVDTTHTRKILINLEKTSWKPHAKAPPVVRKTGESKLRALVGPRRLLGLVASTDDR